LKNLVRRLGKSSLVMEVLHLVMRLLRPRDTNIKYDAITIKKAILSDSNETIEKLDKICYSEISTKVYKEVLKRFKLWKIEEQTRNDKNLQPFVKYL